MDKDDEDRKKEEPLDKVSDVKNTEKKTGVRNRVEEIELNKTKMTFTTPQKKTRTSWG